MESINRRVRLCVLIAEDDCDTADSMAILLDQCGYDVHIACTGPKAIEAARIWKPDVVLLDLGLPGMNGYDVALHLHMEGLDHPPFLIAVTGYGQDSDRAHSAQCGIHLHLLKPVDPADLFVVLQRFEHIVCG